DLENIHRNLELSKTKATFCKLSIKLKIFKPANNTPNSSFFKKDRDT
ncbi:28139_t:CDS:1, partial [Racocetra persica]